ncbi:MAG: Lrp/AsnC family transcriptional regulator [Candidatus Thermoplasmatota archaeon]|jgi:DNA-binding Lrp family transcriptional regulator|nr:Lrp/AsnC family transcriptional regulator [Candidatus Thermoplasmatota archaeon]
MSKSSKDQMGLDEKKVLSELVKNSNKNIETIAKLVGFSKQKTWRIIKRLESKELIWGYTAIFDEEKMGLKHFMVLIKRSMKRLDESTINKIVSRKLEDVIKELGITIESSSYVHGDFDWILTFTAKDIVQAKKFSDALVMFHPGVIDNISIVETLIYIKKHYILNPEKARLKEFL